MAQLVINAKGTKILVDSSKWKISGDDIYNKNIGNIGIGTSIPTAQLHVTRDIRFEGIGTNVINTKLLTTDASGNVTTRTFSNLLAGNAITSMNGLSGSVQTFATGTAGTGFNISSSGSVHTFNMPIATSTISGLISSTDWTSFNNKIASVSATTAAAVSTSSNTATINNTGAYWNANQLMGSAIASFTPTSGQVLGWNGSAWTATTAAPTTTTHIH